MFTYFFVGVLSTTLVFLAVLRGVVRQHNEDEAISELIGAHKLLTCASNTADSWYSAAFPQGGSPPGNVKMFLLDVLYHAYYHATQKIYDRHPVHLDNYAEDNRPKTQCWEHTSAADYVKARHDEIAVAMLIEDSGSPPFEQVDEPGPRSTFTRLIDKFSK